MLLNQPDPQPLYVGIDVAIAKGTRLPVAVCTLRDGQLSPVPKSNFPPPPQGKGNVAALDPNHLTEFTRQTLLWLKGVEQNMSMPIGRIAIDAPKIWTKPGESRRQAERAMDRLGISCIATPTEAAFAAIKQKARQHISGGNPETHLPHSNQIWMLFGFELFRLLGEHWECIEVYPQAIVQTLSAAKDHKSSKVGFNAQILAISKALNLDATDLQQSLPNISYGRRDDKLDALMSAWVASLDPDQRIPLGLPPDDVIWVPKFESLNESAPREKLIPVIPSPKTIKPSGPAVSRTKERGNKGTTKIGYLNRNNQKVIRETDQPGTDHRQYLYVLRCKYCGHEYGSNGSDNWQRKCPQCQNGRPGMQIH